MSNTRTLANPAVEINNRTTPIKPNSLTYKTGKGDRTVRAQSSGGNSVQMVVSDNAETKKSMVKITLLTNKTNAEVYAEYQDSTSGVAIRLSDGTFVKSFRNMILITDPEVTTGADGEFELEFEGPPAV